MAPFPTSPAVITDAWLTEALIASGVLSGGEVVGHGVEPVGEHGAAAQTVRVRLSFDVSVPGLPDTVIAKFASPHVSWRALAAESGMYRREVLFYDGLALRCGDVVPACHFARFDRPSGAFALLLEDMAPARVGSLASPSVGDVESALNAIAAVHARFWDHASRIRWLFSENRPGVATARQAMIEQALPQFLENDPGFAASATVRLARRLAASFQSASVLLSADPATLVHGDFHLQNVFLPTERGGRLAVFDWQTAAKAAGPVDVARLLGTSLTPDQRREYERRLLERYWRRLRSLGVEEYGFDGCWRDYLAGFVLSAFSNVLTGARMDLGQRADFEAASGIDVAAFFGRTDAAIEDHQVEQLL
ncbi:MAG TPA: phosphotransferase [Dehalococcoidia bacterium]|nr:phosphotransferase [Dehalococcoidia bacterium]